MVNNACTYSSSLKILVSNGGRVKFFQLDYDSTFFKEVPSKTPEMTIILRNYYDVL